MSRIKKSFFNLFLFGFLLLQNQELGFCMETVKQYDNESNVGPETQPSASIDDSAQIQARLNTPEDTKVMPVKNAGEALETAQPPLSQEDVVKARNELKELANAKDEVLVEDVERIYNKARAKQKLSELSQASGNSSTLNNNSPQGSPSQSASSSNGGHGGGSSGSSPSGTFEEYQSRSSPFKSDLNKFSKTFDSYSRYNGGTMLSSGALERLRSEFVDIARNSIDMRRGYESSLADNPIFQSLNPDTKDTLKDSFLGLVKNSALDKSAAEDIPYLKDIVTDTNFQFSAEKILGADGLSYLNLATISADMLDVKALTASTYASFLSLSETNGAGAVASGKVNEWMKAADFISSKTFLAGIQDQEFSGLMRTGYSELNDVFKRLSSLKSLDLLDFVDKPMKADLKKVLDAGVLNAVVALRQAKRLKAKEGWDPGLLSNFEYFQKKVDESILKASNTSSSDALLGIFDELLSNNSLRAYWRNFDLPGYFKFRRGVASVYFAKKFEGFKDYQVPEKTVVDLIYARSPKSYPKDKPMFLVTSLALDYVKAQADRTKALALKEKSEDKKYFVQQLASDKYYPSLEDEKN